MRKIEKSPEPKEWTKHRLTPGVDYEAIPELRESLLKEQGYICAYCMRRIPVKDKNSNEKSRIEHILCREKHDNNLKLNYQNMVICCPGAIDDNFHCDKLKANNDITFNLFQKEFIDTISYKTKDGEMNSSDIHHNTEIKNILNLNHSLLKKNRHQTLIGVIKSLNQKKTPWKRSEIQKHLSNWDNRDIEGKFKPYCGIIVWYLTKKLSQL